MEEEKQKSETDALRVEDLNKKAWGEKRQRGKQKGRSLQELKQTRLLKTQGGGSRVDFGNREFAKRKTRMCVRFEHGACTGKQN